jgi:hypothetical protein
MVNAAMSYNQGCKEVFPINTATSDADCIAGVRVGKGRLFVDTVTGADNLRIFSSRLIQIKNNMIIFALETIDYLMNLPFPSLI